MRVCASYLTDWILEQTHRQGCQKIKKNIIVLLHFQKVGQKKDILMQFLAICIDILK
jgi:hypothetical protein